MSILSGTDHGVEVVVGGVVEDDEDTSVRVRVVLLLYLRLMLLLRMGPRLDRCNNDIVDVVAGDDDDLVDIDASRLVLLLLLFLPPLSTTVRLVEGDASMNGSPRSRCSCCCALSLKSNFDNFRLGIANIDDDDDNNNLLSNQQES